MEYSNENIGKRFAQLRKNAFLTQEKLAEELNISIKHCSAVERGAACFSLDKLIEVCEYFDVTLDYLVRGIEPSEYDHVLSTSVVELFKRNEEQEVALFKEYVKMFHKLRTMPRK